MGTIRERWREYPKGSGKKEKFYIYQFKDAEGKWRELWNRKKKEAEARGRDAEAKVFSGTYSPKGVDITFGEALDALERHNELRHSRRDKMDDFAKDRMAGNTLATYQNLIKNHVRPALGALRLSEITHSRLQGFVDGLCDNYSGIPQWANIVIKRTLDLAVYNGHIAAAANPLLGRPLRVWRTPDPIVIPDLSKVQKLIDLVLQGRFSNRQTAFSHQTQAAIIVIAATTGMRIGEILGLQAENLDFVEGWIHIRHSQSIRDGLKAPKREASIRDVPLFPLVRQVLLPIMERRGWPKTGHIFLGRRGKPISPVAAYDQYFRNPMARLGFTDEKGTPEFRLHDLRHVAVSLMKAHGIPIEEISRIIGHKNTAITQRVYMHLFKERSVAREKLHEISLSLAPRAQILLA
jgi:integrase